MAKERGVEYIGDNPSGEIFEDRRDERGPGGRWTKKPELSDEKRCKYILDHETGRRCQCPAVDDTGFCHVHGPNAEKWHRKGGIARGEDIRRLWDERKKKAEMLEKAGDWKGYKTLLLAALADEYCAGHHIDKKIIVGLLQRLEVTLIHQDRTGRSFEKRELKATVYRRTREAKKTDG
jgi:hypothetical protein